MRRTWERIDSWLRNHAPEVFASLHPGAPDEAIHDAEVALRLELPEPVRDSFRIHNGQDPDGPGLFNACEFLSLDRVIEEWTVWEGLRERGEFDDSESDSDGPIQPDWWNPRWVPLTYDGLGNHHCLDLDPAPGGNPGQILIMWHDDPFRPLIAPDLPTWLDRFADDLESGCYHYSADEGGLVRADPSDLDGS